MNILERVAALPADALMKLTDDIAEEVCASGKFTDIESASLADTGGAVYTGNKGGVLVKDMSVSNKRAVFSIEALDMDVLQKSNPWMAKEPVVVATAEGESKQPVVVNVTVNMPTPEPTTRRVERDREGNISRIVEEPKSD